MRSTNTALWSLKTLPGGTAVLIGKTPESSPFVLLIDRSSISATNRPSRKTLIDTVGFSFRKDNSMFWYGFRMILHSTLRISGTIMPQWVPFQCPILAPKYLKTSSGSISAIWISLSLALGSSTNQVSLLVTTWNVWLFSQELVVLIP